MRTQGSYSIEGALAISIFSICMLALLSLITIVKVEGEVQDAIKETALELSEQAYVLEKQAVLPEKIPGALTAKLLSEKNFHRSGMNQWLQRQGIPGGMAGIDYAGSEILSDGVTIRIRAQYLLLIKTAGLFHKTILVRQDAVTDALLSEAARERLLKSAAAASIWQKPAFQRGRFFVDELKRGGGGQAVISGQGVDLYDARRGRLIEEFSMNLFEPYYSIRTGERKAPSSYTPIYEAMEREILSYGKDFTKDVRKLRGRLKMPGGTNSRVRGRQKQMILTVPVEVKENAAMQKMLRQVAGELQKKYGISLDVQYREEALL